MDRLMAFNSFKTHPWLCKSFGKLKAEDYNLALQFIEQHKTLSKDDFELKVNRMFLDFPVKPKNFKLILELLSCANSKV